MKRIAILFFLFLSFACTNTNNKNAQVNFADTSKEKSSVNTSETDACYIAIASMTSPKETYSYYNDLVNYISKKSGQPIFIKQKKSYEEVNLLLENADVDFAFICSGAFVEEYSSGKMRLLVAPQIDQKTLYQAYIITQKTSGISSFRDFENKQFAFSDPLSNTGRFYPLKKLAQLSVNEENFFQKTIYTYGHDISIQMVNRGIVDGASVHGLIYDYIAMHHPERIENIKIIEKSEYFGIPPVVVPSSLSEECFKKYQDIFLNLHTDSIGKSILDKLNIDKFVHVDDSIYNSVFQLKELINNAK